MYIHTPNHTRWGHWHIHTTANELSSKRTEQWKYLKIYFVKPKLWNYDNDDNNNILDIKYEHCCVWFNVISDSYFSIFQALNVSIRNVSHNKVLITHKIIFHHPLNTCWIRSLLLKSFYLLQNRRCTIRQRIRSPTTELMYFGKTYLVFLSTLHQSEVSGCLAGRNSQNATVPYLAAELKPGYWFYHDTVF